MTYSYKLTESRLTKWHFWFSYAAVAALLMLWLQPLLLDRYTRWDSSESVLSLAGKLISPAIFVGAFFIGPGLFFILRAYYRRPKQLDSGYRRSEWKNTTCKKHARGDCRTCMRGQWMLNRCNTWLFAAILYYFGLGIMLLTSDLFKLRYIPLGFSTVCGLFLWVSIISPDIFHFSQDRPLEWQCGLIKSPVRGERRLPQFVLVLSWIILLFMCLWLHDIELCRITITSITLYFIAVFWGTRSGALHRFMMDAVKGLGQRAARYRDEAMQGGARAQFRFGLLYEEGNGVQIDLPEANSWYRKAAEQGLADAQVKIGNMYYHGSTVPCDYEQAKTWFRKAAEQGNAVAMNSLGVMYAFGPNELKAAAAYNDTVFTGDMVAQQAYAGMLYAAKKEPKNYLEGYFWLCLATAMDSSVVEDRDEVAAKLTPAELCEVQERIAVWFAQHRRN